ncbi:TniQ family protein [Variovorax sp. CCNWLW225]|uniref:TniQ domain-containing protein n=1 Tax=Variovorax beijingensis TaxID=2496117 RepID=A0ABY0A6K4_9BURK|nr:TniQ family protein [Variovorax beijingensis]RSZ36581.1 hypothetical protein EJO66_15120 [Variovorax beijingensis]
MQSSSLPVSGIVQKNRQNRKLAQADHEIEFRRPPYLPVLPPGGLLYSTVVFVGRSMGTSFENACDTVYRSAASPKHANVLGRRLQDATDCIGDGTLSYQDVLMNHSVWGFYSRLVPASVEFGWTQRMTGDSMTGETSVVYPRLVYLGPSRSSRMKYCPMCASLDAKTSGFPIWRVIHQLPFVEVCAAHQVTLVHSCSHCGEVLDRGTHFRLPGQVCRSCGSQQAHHANRHSSASSPAALTKLCEEIFSGSQEYLRPENWLALVKDLQTKHSIEKLANDVHRQLENLYGREPNVAPHLVDAISKRSVVHQLSLLSLPRQFLSRILVGDQLTRMGLIDRSEASFQQHLTDADALELKAVEQGIPAGFVKLLLNGVSPLRLCRDYGGAYQQLVAFQGSIPPGFEVSERLHNWRASQREARKHALRLSMQPGYRAVLDEFVRLNPGCNLNAFRAAHPTEHKWLFVNDRPHLQAILPARIHTRGKTLEEKREKHRAVILDLLRENPQVSRTQIRLLGHSNSSDFLERNDKVWFDAMIPSRRRAVNKAVPSWYTGASPFVWPDTPLKGRYASTVDRRNCCKTYISQLIELNPQLTAKEVTTAGRVATLFLRQDSPKWLVKKLGEVKAR